MTHIYQITVHPEVDLNTPSPIIWYLASSTIHRRLDLIWPSEVTWLFEKSRLSDLNWYSFRNWYLKPARMPISPNRDILDRRCFISMTILVELSITLNYQSIPIEHFFFDLNILKVYWIYDLGDPPTTYTNWRDSVRTGIALVHGFLFTIIILSFMPEQW